MKSTDPTQDIMNHWWANTSVMLLVSEETNRMLDSIKAAIRRIQEERGDIVQTVAWDRASTFHTASPVLVVPKAARDLKIFEAALVAAMGDADHMPDNIGAGMLPFDVRGDAIIVMKDVHWHLTQSPSKHVAIQMLRNIIQANMASSGFWGEDSNGEPLRGRRMLVLLAPVEQRPDDLPEIDPMIIPLPDDAMLDQSVGHLLQDLAAAKGVEVSDSLLSPEGRRLIVRAGRGFSQQKWDDTLNLVVAEQRGLDCVEAVLQTIQRRKAQMLEGIAGIRYVPAEDIPFDHLPGYEDVETFLADRMAINPDLASRHKVQPVRGITLVGMPGTGKTQFAMLAAKLLKRDLIIWSLGETQEGLVGASERNARRAINAIQAIGAVALIDDVDKAGMNVAADGRSGDSGTFGRIVQMLLTEMSQDTNRAMWIFTANRIGNIPGEMIRAGRMDERFLVVRPDRVTREQILRLHIAAHALGVDPDQEKLLDRLARETEDWVGAELADLVNKAVVHSVAHGADTWIDIEWMLQRASETNPMIKQPLFAPHIEEMEAQGEQFRHVGCVRNNDTNEPRHRAGRNLKI